MADAFLSRDTEAALLKALDKHLSGRSFICGGKMMTDDVKVFAAISGEPSSESYPNTIIWYKYVKNALLWSYRKKAGWVSMDGQEASVEQSKNVGQEANAEDVLKRQRREKKLQRGGGVPQKEREQKMMLVKTEEPEEEEKEAAEEAAKASESKKPGMWSLEVVDAGKETINRLKKNVTKLSTIMDDVKSAELVCLGEHEGRKTVRIDVTTTPFEDIDPEYSAYFDDFIHAVLLCDSD